MIEGLPWGEREVGTFKALLHAKVDAFEAGRGVLRMRGSDVQSEASYQASPARVARHRRNIDAFWPKEPVVADHQAEAVRIVYEGMLAAGYVARPALRAERVGFVG